MGLPRLPFIVLSAAILLLHQSTYAQNQMSACSTSPHVIGFPEGGPRGNNDWFANADRTIWATFWGWDFVGHGPLEAYPRNGYIATPKVLWYKPNGYRLIVTGRRLDGVAPPILYDTSLQEKRGPIQVSRIDFPTAGCWELDAKSENGTSDLQFVVQVKYLEESTASRFAMDSHASANQSVAGVWKVQDVGYAPWMLKFQVDGDVVQGTVQQTRRLHLLPFVPFSPFEPAKIYDGLIAGDKISFKCDSPDHHGNRTVSFTGVIQGDQIAFTRTVTIKQGGFRGEDGIFGAHGASHFKATRDTHS